MSIYLQLHPVSPQRRFIRQAVEVLRGGGVIVYPTDSCYALGCHIGDKAALERIRQIRQTDRNHHFTLVCRDLSDVGKYAVVDNSQYRLLRAHTPGAYTFLLKASRETPRRLKHERRGTIGLRVPDHPVTALLLTELGEPVMSSTLLLPGEQLPRTDAKEIYERLEHSVDLVLDGGNCGLIAHLRHRPVGRPCRRAARGPRRRQPLCKRGNRIMRGQCGQASSCYLSNTECKHWIYLHFLRKYPFGPFPRSLRLPCTKSRTDGWLAPSATAPPRCSDA